jgi:hypothetical protein
MSTDERLDEKDCVCSHCNDSGISYYYNRDGDVTNMPCPECTEDPMSHIRNWDWKGQMFDG